MPPDTSPDFQHGYTNGIGGVNRETYEGYLSSQVHMDWLMERIQEKRSELAAVDRQLTETTATNRTTFAQLQTHTDQVDRLVKAVGRCEADRQALEADQTTLRERRAKAAPDYSLFAGLLFLIAGISFLAGDLIISHEIVAYALNIRNTNEAWAFAVGLAMVSILLKPAYDRLIEQPYVENPAREGRRYARFKTMLSVFAVVTLAVLGWFRYEAYRTDQLKAAINKSIRQLQLTTDPMEATQTLSASTLDKIEAQLAASSELNLALVNSPWALLSFVLSGILFALAGAVCLGIALPVLTAFWFRWLQADIKLGKLRRRLTRATQKLDGLETQLAGERSQQQVLQHTFNLLPDLAELKAQRVQLVADLATLQSELKLAHTDSRISTFNDGYQRGEVSRDGLTDEVQQQLRSGLLSRQTGAEPPLNTLSPVNGKTNGLSTH